MFAKPAFPLLRGHKMTPPNKNPDRRINIQTPPNTPRPTVHTCTLQPNKCSHPVTLPARIEQMFAPDPATGPPV